MLKSINPTSRTPVTCLKCFVRTASQSRYKKNGPNLPKPNPNSYKSLIREATRRPRDTIRPRSRKPFLKASGNSPRGNSHDAVFKHLEKIQKLAEFASVPPRHAIRKPVDLSRLNRKNASFYSFDSSSVSHEAVDVPAQPPVPELAHNLDRTLFNPGVHFLRDPRTNVYNFTPYLENIMSIKDFDFNYTPRYVPSGKDGKLAQIAKQHDRKYTGSTSSLTSVLSHFHYLLSQERAPHLLNVSKVFRKLHTDFSFAQRKPVSVFLKYNPITDTHSVDSDTTGDQELIVTILGNSLETLLTTPEVEYELYHKSRSHQLDPSLKETTSTYSYTACGDFLMRSQLDCYDSRLPGTGMFDLKTRAVCAVRHDIDYAQIYDGTNYIIRKLYGEFESFEREWYECIRSTLLKYSLQARIGRMDGIFIAYHNIRRMFGFQYVPLIEMDKILHCGNLVNRKSAKEDVDDIMTVAAPLIANAEFNFSVNLLAKLLDQIIHDHGDRKQDFNLVFYKDQKSRQMSVFVKPVSHDVVNYLSDSESTIWEDARKNLSLLPENIRLYEVDNINYVNGKVVEYDDHPTLTRQTDVWKVDTAISRIKNPELIQNIYSRTFSEYLDMKQITSTPFTDRLDFEAEEARLLEAIQNLPPPTNFQAQLRNLAEKGLRHQKELEQKFGDKEIQIWFPRPLNLVGQKSKELNKDPDSKAVDTKAL